MKQDKQIYLTGGAVRDALIGRMPKDFDYVCIGYTTQDMLDEGYKQVDAEFPVFIKGTSEYALARKEKSTGSGYRDFTTDSTNVTLEEDLMRRDLTINTFVMTLTGEVLDPLNISSDMENKILRHVSDAFFEDPVRVLRLARIQAELPDFRIHESTIELIRNNKETLRNLTPERILKEMQKALATDTPSLYFRTLKFLGVLDIVYPELYVMSLAQQKPQHHAEGDVFQHSMMVLDECSKLTKDSATRYGALYHDIAKPISDPLNQGFHKGHDSEDLVLPQVLKLKEAYRLPKLWAKAVINGALWHMKLHNLHKMKDTTIAKMLHDKHFPKTKEELIQLLNISTADARGRFTIGYGKAEPEWDSLLLCHQMCKAYSPYARILDYKVKNNGNAPSIDCIKQWKHRYAIKCVQGYLRPVIGKIL